MFTLDDKWALQTNGSLTITDHPTDPIEIDCQKCGPLPFKEALLLRLNRSPALCAHVGDAKVRHMMTRMYLMCLR